MGFLTGKTAIITGAGRAVLSDGSCGSIGYGIATAYAKEGANIVITGRNVKKLQAAKEELEAKYGVKVLTVQADIAAGNDTFSDRHPCFQAKTRGLQRDIILHPFAQPWFDVDVVCLQPDPTVIQQPVVITQIHSNLHNTVLPGQTGETDLAFSAMSVFTVKPGKLRDRQFCTLA